MSSSPHLPCLGRSSEGFRAKSPEPRVAIGLTYSNPILVIATSGPSGTYPQRAYRNPLDELVKFLDYKHGENWCIWEFRAEGTGYPDSEVYNRIHHFPWPDHHPPPFALIPKIMVSMRNWLHPEEAQDQKAGVAANGESRNPQKRVVVVHCKAGKGRSGTVATSYLISQEGWKKEDALQRFTQRRMRVGFGNGVSIPSQLRYVGYVDRWANHLGKRYVDRPVEILEIHTWGLRDGVKVIVQGYEDEGKRMKNFHLFHRHERTVVEAGDNDPPIATTPPTAEPAVSAAQPSSSSLPTQLQVPSPASDLSTRTTATSNLSAIIFRPHKRIVIPNSDVNIDFERRSKASYTGFTMVTSVAHVWFNAFFEGGDQYDSGVFELEWDAMDGIKGSARKGIRSFERMKVVWRYPADQNPQPPHDASVTDQLISEAKPDQPALNTHVAMARTDADLSMQSELPNTSLVQAQGKENIAPAKDDPSTSSPAPADQNLLAVNAGSLHELQRQLGVRKQTDESKDVSLAGTDDEARSIMTDDAPTKTKDVNEHSDHGAENDDYRGVQSYLGQEDSQRPT